MGRRRKKELQRYAQMLAASGMDEREVARGFFYAQRYGLEAMESSGCVLFAEPSCGDWDCVNPEHQVLDRREP